MPCIKCANGKWKYGEHGRCQFDTLKECKAAAAAIHIQDEGPHVPALDGKGTQCEACKPQKAKPKSKK